MLFGGRELPARPLWVRLLTIAAVVWMAAPLIRFSLGPLQDQFFKMSLEETQALLETHPRLQPVGHPPKPPVKRDVRCEPGSGGWDYFCSYVTDGHHLGLNVRVGHRSIQQMVFAAPVARNVTR